MERIHVQTSSSGASELALVWADAYIDGLAESERVSKMRGELSEDRTLHVGYIETTEDQRRTGIGARLLMHTIAVLAVRRLTAETVTDGVDDFFARVGALAGVEVETV